MKTNHTSGSWNISKANTYNNIPDAIFEIGTEKNIIATIHGNHYTHTTVSEEEAKANAKLIAAAPELLEACMEIRKTLGALIDFKGLPEQDIKRFELIQKAIKKATE